MTERPYWWPVLTDDLWIAQIRASYPEDTDGLSDEGVREHFAGGRKYADVWDHLGDARDDWEMLADAFLETLQFINHARRAAQK